MSRRLPARLAVGALFVALFSACGNATDAPAKVAASRDNVFPVTVDHVHGETTIDSAPSRVVALASADQDAALALGVVPVAVSDRTPWFDAELTRIKGTEPAQLDLSKGIDVAAIRKLDPDVILSTGRDLTDREYAELTSVAPVIAEDEDGMSWQDSLESAGDVLGKAGSADELEDATDKVIGAGAAEQTGMKGTSFIFGHIDPTNYRSFDVYTSRDAKVSLMKDFGLVEADVVDDQPDNTDMVKVKGEDAGTLKSEILLLLPGSAREVVALEGNPMLGKIPAILDGRAYAELNKTLQLAISQPSTLSIPRVIEKFLPEVAVLSDF